MTIAAQRPELDSRILAVSIGYAGVVRPRIVRDLERIFCLNCGAPAGAVTQELPPGVIFMCDRCEGRFGALPLEAVTLQRERG